MTTATSVPLLWIALTLLVGVTLGWLWGQAKAGDDRISAAAQREATSLELAGLRQSLLVAQAALEDKDRLVNLREEEIAGLRRTAAAAGEEAAGLRAQLLAEQSAAQDKVKALLEVEVRLKDSFEKLAGNALDANSRRLLQLNQQELERQQTKVATDLTTRERAIETMLAPMQDSLKKLETQTRAMELNREGAYQAVLTEIKNIQSSHVDLRRETSQLVQALRAPKVRGNWGEMQLRRCVEFAGMLEHASFEVEQFVRGETVSVRPDMVVKLPNGRSIIVDAKTPLSAFLEASGCDDEVQRMLHMAAHARQVKAHLDNLSGKAYWKQFKESPDFVVCFLPSEVLFSAALEQDPGLLEYSASSNVLLATPTTLIALLKAVAFGWQQSQIAQDAERIRDIAMTVHQKLAGMHGAILDLGKKLRSAGDAYDDMLVKAEGRGGLFSVARKLRELKIGERDLAESKPTAMRLKVMEAEDWQSGLSLAASADAFVSSGIARESGAAERDDESL